MLNDVDVDVFYFVSYLCLPVYIFVPGPGLVFLSVDLMLGCRLGNACRRCSLALPTRHRKHSPTHETTKPSRTATDVCQLASVGNRGNDTDIVFVTFNLNVELVKFDIRSIVPKLEKQ
jgi:hypothetical protein